MQPKNLRYMLSARERDSDLMEDLILQFPKGCFLTQQFYVTCFLYENVTSVSNFLLQLPTGCSQQYHSLDNAKGNACTLEVVASQILPLICTGFLLHCYLNKSICQIRSPCGLIQIIVITETTIPVQDIKSSMELLAQSMSEISKV